MRIVVDAMGGDNAPAVNVEGALAALRAYPDMHITLTGQEELLRPLLNGTEDVAERLTVLHAPEVIGMDDAPVMAVRRKTHSSLVEGMLLVKNKQADAFVSAGSTGAVLAGGMFRIGRIDGIERPAIATPLPLPRRMSLLIDGGANVDCQPEWLEQFALMGAIYMRRVAGVADPAVALVNIGVEEEKGNDTVKKAHALLSRPQPYRFTGNLEARDVSEGMADVLVCDGFVGNVVLKVLEGMAKTIFGQIKQGTESSLRAKLGGLLMRPMFRSLRGMLDATEVGGAPFLGVQGVVIKAHGNSNARAIFCAIRQARSMVEAQVVRVISEEVARLTGEQGTQA